MATGDASTPDARDPSRESPLLAALRLATREHHERIERRLSLLDRVPPLTRAAYCRLLEAFLGFHAPLEERLGAIPWASIGFDFEPRRRARLACLDLAALGVERSASDPSPLCSVIPRVSSPNEGLGCLYVLEGSTLGGQLISRYLSQHLGVTPSSGGAFFYGHGPATGAMWRAYLGHLVAVAPADERAVTDLARATFEALERWLDEQRVLR